MMPFWIAMQFLTVFPIQLKQMPSKQQNGQSLLFYPVIGLGIGLVLYTIAIGLSALPSMLLSSLILVIWIWLTGGLHLDGLADTADAWVGGFGDKERTLKIMKDPACGPIGVLSLIIVCILKWSAIYVLLEKQYVQALILFPMLGRLVPLFLFLTTDYVREKGLGSSIANYIPKMISIIVACLSLSLFTYFSWLGLGCIIISILILLYLRQQFIRRIDGITGDTVGASIELVEMAAILSFVVLSFYI
ncbi:MAG: adenosylcobinamide-GDP ribazoletransferase [Acinetobacter sp.]